MAMRLSLLAALPFLVAAGGRGPLRKDPPHTPIPDFENLECSFHQLAFEFGTKIVPSSPQALHDALNLDSCKSFADESTLRSNAQILAAPPTIKGELPSSGPTYYVATTGSDATGSGTESAPFASLHAAAAAIRKAATSGTTTVLVRAGKYYFNETLTLGNEDSNVRWAAYRGEKVVLSGGKLLSPQWETYKGKIEVATIDSRDVVSAAERRYFASLDGSHPAPPVPSAGHDWGPPPAKWNTLHVGGVRQVRARFPNGDPQQGSGICFSKANRDGEGCSSYLAARGGLGCVADSKEHEGYNCSAAKSLPTATPGAQISFDLDRGKSPKQGCRQCSTYGTFKTTIYPPPDGHPVYNKPMPGLGWQNNSLFSFWGSPFSRPAGVQYNSTDNVPKLEQPAGAVVQMFHGGLWGGWTYSVAAQTDSALEFGYGGYQEARGSGINKNHYYIENDLSLLDQPAEWYLLGPIIILTADPFCIGFLNCFERRPRFLFPGIGTLTNPRQSSTTGQTLLILPVRWWRRSSNRSFPLTAHRRSHSVASSLRKLGRRISSSMKCQAEGIGAYTEVQPSSCRTRP